MTPSSGQLRAYMLSSLSVEPEATGGSPEDYDDRNGYLPDLPLLKVTAWGSYRHESESPMVTAETDLKNG